MNNKLIYNSITIIDILSVDPFNNATDANSAAKLAIEQDPKTLNLYLIN